MSINSGLREAPPTRKPSTSFWAASSLQVPPVTEPEKQNGSVSRAGERNWKYTSLVAQTSVNDPHRVGHCLRNVGLKPGPQLFVNLLSLRSHTKYALGYVKNQPKSSVFQFISDSFVANVPAGGKQSCRYQWPKQVHKQARPCSSLLHCLEKRRVIRLKPEFHNRSNAHYTHACTKRPWKVRYDTQTLPIQRPRFMFACVRGCVYVSLTCDDLGLSKDNLLCDAALPLVQLLTNAGDDTQTVLKSVGCLLTNELKPYQNSYSWWELCVQQLFSSPNTCCIHRWWT